MVLTNGVLLRFLTVPLLFLVACAGSSDYRILDSSNETAEYSGFSLSSSLYFFNTDGGAVELDDDGVVLPGAGNPWQDFEVLNGDFDLNEVRSRVAGAVDTVFVPPTPPEEPQGVVVTVPVETTEGTS